MGFSVSSFVSYTGCLIIYAVVDAFVICSSVAFDYFYLNVMILVFQCVIVLCLSQGFWFVLVCIHFMHLTFSTYLCLFSMLIESGLRF